MNVICIQRSVASCRLLTSSSSQFVLDSGNSGEIPTAWVVVPENTYQCHLDSLWIFRHWQDPLQLKPVSHMRHFRNQQQENIVAQYHTVATIAKPRNLLISYFMVALCNTADHIYFHPVSFFLSSSFLFPRLISAAGDWMSTILLHMVWP